jgi:hypothetical protein
MAHKTASIWKYVHTTNGWRYCKPVMKANHEIDPRRVFVGGRIEEYPSGQFYLHIAGKWLPVEPVEAVNSLRTTGKVKSRRYASVGCGRGWRAPLKRILSEEFIRSKVRDCGQNAIPKAPVTISVNAKIRLLFSVGSWHLLDSPGTGQKLGTIYRGRGHSRAYWLLRLRLRCRRQRLHAEHRMERLGPT